MKPEILPVIAVIGSGTENHREFSLPLGKWLAQNGFHLINGGGGGVMAETARAFLEVKTRKGKIIGVLPSSNPCKTAEERARYQSPPGYPNAFTEIVIPTHLPDSGSQGKRVSSRNHIIILTANLVVALPGGPGTRSEIELALEYKKRLILLSPHEEWKEYEQQAVIFLQLNDLLNRLKLLKDQLPQK